MSLEERFDIILKQIRQKEAAYARIAVIGQPGAGKSSIINNLIGRKVAETGQRTDVTTEATEYACEEKFEKFVDLPGYGTQLFEFDNWKNKFSPEKYDVYICVFSGKLLEDDQRLFEELKNWSESRHRPIFIVRNHCTDIETEWDREQIRTDILSKAGGLFQNIYFVDCGRNKSGISTLKDAIWQTDFSKAWRSRLHLEYQKAKQEYLANSQLKAKDTIATYSKVASVNGINPIPGVDVAADIGIYISMFQSIRECYDIETEDLSMYAFPVAKKLLELLTKEGILILLRNFASKEALKTATKYIPLLGQAAAAILAYQMASYAGEQYDEDCHKLSNQVLDSLVEREKSSLLSVST